MWNKIFLWHIHFHGVGNNLNILSNTTSTFTIQLHSDLIFSITKHNIYKYKYINIYTCTFLVDAQVTIPYLTILTFSCPNSKVSLITIPHITAFHLRYNDAVMQLLVCISSYMQTHESIWLQEKKKKNHHFLCTLIDTSVPSCVVRWIYMTALFTSH